MDYPLLILQQELRAADERAEIFRACRGIAPATREAGLATCAEQALHALELVGADVIARSFEQYVIYNGRGLVAELYDVRALPEDGRPPGEGGPYA